MRGWFFVVALTCLLPFMVGCSEDRSKEDKPTAPTFTLKDLSGREVSLSDFRGKVVLLDFWATWCPPCLLSIPHLNALHRAYGERGFEILGINLDQGDPDNLSAFVEKMKITYPILIGTSEVTKQYGVNPIPTGFLVDREGHLRVRIIGFNETIQESMAQEIEKLLKEN